METALFCLPRSLIPGSASLMVWNDADRFAASNSFHLSVGKLSIGPTCCIPVCVCVCVHACVMHVPVHYEMVFPTVHTCRYTPALFTRISGPREYFSSMNLNMSVI